MNHEPVVMDLVTYNWAKVTQVIVIITAVSSMGPCWIPILSLHRKLAPTSHRENHDLKLSRPFYYYTLQIHTLFDNAFPHGN